MPALRPLFVLLGGLAVAVVALIAITDEARRTDAQADQYLYFPGPGSGYLESPDNAALNPATAVTIEAWVFLNSYDSYDETAPTGRGIEPVIVSKNHEQSYMLTIWGGRPRFYSGNDAWAAPSEIPLGEWVHVAAAFDGTDVRIYINGVIDTTESLVGGLGTSTDPLRIGFDGEHTESPDGAVDEVRLWDFARSGQDIADDMNTTITQPTTGLICAWNMEGDANADVGPCTGSLVDDSEFRDEPLTPPTPTAEPTPSPTASAAPATIVWGNSDCDGDGITTRDNQGLLRNVLSQGALSQTEPCPDIGATVTVDDVPRIWGDWDCDGEITTRDNQALLRNVLSQAALSQTEPCPDIGTEVVLS